MAFIICSNNDLYCNECVRYIEELIVPDGYEIDIIGITGADSIAEAYNAAMKSSDAKYKVYLHQDVFIYHKNFIYDIISIFQENDILGMLGMIGGVNLPKNAIVWNVWNRGATYACNNVSAVSLVGIQDKETRWTEVEAIDGMIMITQYDIEWREDLQLGWDFYDVSQSLEFRRNGYKVGVPYQEEPWCMHDCGHSKLIAYDDARSKILKEYTEYFESKFEPVYDRQVFFYQEKNFQQLKLLLEQKLFMQAVLIKKSIEKYRIVSNPLQYAYNLIEIYEKESVENQLKSSFFQNLSSWEKMKERYDEIKFLVRRANLNMELEENMILLDMIKNGELSKEAVLCIIRHCV